MTTKHTRKLRGFAAAFTLGILALQARAGDIVGSVFDGSTKGSLSGATVSVVDSDVTTVVDSGGNFRLTGLAAGSYALRVTHVGYNTQTEKVAVPASGEAKLNVAMGSVALESSAVATAATGNSEVLKLEKITVGGYMDGRERALGQKQNATNISDIISADAIGDLPDRNVAEALARLPGVNLSSEQGEGIYVSIRGSEPNLNQVMMDGATMAAPGGSRLGRAVPLDTLGAGQISSIEVIKSVTPDMDANSIGGTINIKSASAFNIKDRRISGSVAGTYNGNGEKLDGAAQFSYLTRFGPNKTWGISASLNYDKRNYANEWMQVGWSSVTLNGTQRYLPNDFELKPEWGYKVRSGITANLEWRPDANTEFYFRPGYTHTHNPEHRFEVIYSPTVSATSVTMTSDTAGTFIGNNRSERRSFDYVNDQDLANASAGFKKTLGDFVIEPMITYSEAKANNPYTTDREFRNANGKTGPIAFDLGTGFVPVSWVVNPAIDVPANYPLRRTRDDWGIQEETIYSAKADVTWNLPRKSDLHGFLKAGGKFLHRSRDVDLESRRLVPVGTWNLAQTGDQLPSRPVYDGQFQTLFLPNQPAIDAFIAANPALVTHDLAGESTNSIEDDYQIEEYIYSGYLMGKFDIKKFTLLGGVRYEKTDATIRAVLETTKSGSSVPVRTPTSGVTSYDNLFPNIQGVFHFTEQLLLRAAYTETIGRPAYEDARTLAILNYSPIVSPTNPAYPNSGSVTVGNPQLKPYGSKNYDLSLEWYAKKGGGSMSLAAFRKDISDPIYSYTETQHNVVYQGLGFESLSYNSKLNGTSGKISGLEFSVYQPFKFLPSPFDGFGIEANYTKIESSEVIPTRPGEDIPFFRQPDKIANLTLFYEKYNFSGRIAYTYAGEQIYTLGSNLLGDRYQVARGQYDMLLKYRFNKHYSVTGSVRNLTNVPDERSYGIKNLVQQSRLLYADYKVSVDFNF